MCLNISHVTLCIEILCIMTDVGIVLMIFLDRLIKKISHMQKNIYWLGSKTFLANKSLTFGKLFP